MTATRRLAAILAVDVVGYSRLIGADEEGTPQPAKGDPIGLYPRKNYSTPGPHRQDYRGRLAGRIRKRR
jgi:hypothetical protein